jgi:hypothetical protein
MTADIDWSTVPNAAKTIDMLDFDRWSKVNVETLDMGSVHKCVLSQMYAEDYARNPNKHKCSSAYGYAIKELEILYSEAAFTFSRLRKEEWLIEIKKRQL